MLKDYKMGYVAKWFSGTGLQLSVKYVRRFESCRDPYKLSPIEQGKVAL